MKRKELEKHRCLIKPHKQRVLLDTCCPNNAPRSFLSNVSSLSLDDSVFSLDAFSTPPRRLRDESTMISPHLSPSTRRLFAEIDDFRFRNREWFDSDLRQAQLKPDTVPKLHEALPALTDSFIGAMMSPLWRSYDPNLIQEPTVYRFFYSFFHLPQSLLVSVGFKVDGFLSG